MSTPIASAYFTDCRLLKALARVLDLSAVETTTAFTYLHKIRLGEHQCQLTGQELVTACIYLAAKVEEVTISSNQLINSARLLCHPSQQHLLQSLAPLGSPSHTVSQLPPQQQQQQQQQPDAPALAGYVEQYTPQPEPGQDVLQQQQPQQQHAMPPAGAACVPSPQVHHHHQQQQQQQQLEQDPMVVTGDAYYVAKDRLFTAEQVVLRLMNFQLPVQQPHKQVLNYCRLLAAPAAVAAAAVCLLNDAVAYTGICISHSGAVVAAAALQLAARLALQSLHAGCGSRDRTASTRQQGELRNRMSQEDGEYRLPAEQRQSEDMKHSNSSSGRHRPHEGPHARVPESSSSKAARADADVAAIAEGGWIHLIGLQQGDVDKVVQMLEQLLQQQQAWPSQATH